MPNLSPFDENGPIRVMRHDPVGTLEELRASNLDPAQYACCHRQVKDADGNWEIYGCPKFKDCRRPEKEGNGVPRIRKDAEGKPVGQPLTAGPFNLGLRYIKQTPTGKKVVVFPDSCVGLALKREPYESNGILDVVAVEGETIMTRGSTFTDVTVPGEGLKRVVTDKTDLPYTIPFFPRPAENPTLAAEVFASGEVERELVKRKDDQRERALGVKR